MGSKNRPSANFEELFGSEIFGKLQMFRDELVKWNRKFSFTSVPDKEIFQKLVAPSAWLGKEYAAERIGVIADFGSGPGIPGIPMAIVDRENRYTLFDSNEKKAGFCRHCSSLPGLINKGHVKTCSVRIAPDSKIEPVDRIVARASGEIVEILDLWSDKVHPGAVADFFKGNISEKEVQEGLNSYPEAAIEILKTPDWFENLSIIRIKDVF